MTVAAETPTPIERGPAPSGTATVPATIGRRTPVSSLVVAGLIATLASAWGGIVPFVGPTFGFSADGTGSWLWNLNHSLLSLLPGAVGFAAGLAIMMLARRAVVGRGRGELVVMGLAAVAAGAWFVIGPWALVVVHSSSHFYFAVPSGTSRLHELALIVGYSLGTGLVVATCGAFCMGWAIRHRSSAGPGTPAMTLVAPVLGARGEHAKSDDAHAVLVVPASEAVLVQSTAPGPNGAASAQRPEHTSEPEAPRGGWLAPASKVSPA